MNTTDRSSRLYDLFARAIGLPAADRAAFLQSACDGDAGLRREIETLLNRAEAAEREGFLQPPPRPTAAPDLSPILETDPLIGAKVGRYTILETIGAGGMGTVYLAEQEAPRRHVALKVISGGASPTLLRRFQHESQILAKLQHPNIAQVYEAGNHRLETGATASYFAMEYVPNARPITKHADEHDLPIRERLELFATVCDAVQHGHTKGVMHRDLKPGNILVGQASLPASAGAEARPTVKVIDFGVARATDADVSLVSMHTDTGQLMGTLQYMSPEQTEADPHNIDTRSDVYSLGVVLYELVCGCVPYDVSRTTIMGACRLICEGIPERPSAIWRGGRRAVDDANRDQATPGEPARHSGRPALDNTKRSQGTPGRPAHEHHGRPGGRPLLKGRSSGDLELIVLKALEKDRSRRYQSVAELRDDIRRYLSGEPIAARPATAWTRVLRWAGKHPIGSTSIAWLVMIVAVATVSASILQYLRTQPHDLIRKEDGREAHLISRAGTIEHIWKSEARGGIVFAELIELPDLFDGGRIAVIGYSTLDTGAFAKCLCAYDVDGNRDRPVWCRKVENEEVLKELVDNRKIDGGHFNLQLVKIDDIFPGDEHPGAEIVTVFASHYSQRIIRIYDLGGELLYEAWHDGAVGIPHWMEDARLLIFAGDEQW